MSGKRAAALMGLVAIQAAMWGAVFYAPFPLVIPIAAVCAFASMAVALYLHEIEERNDPKEGTS